MAYIGIEVTSNTPYSVQVNCVAGNDLGGAVDCYFYMNGAQIAYYQLAKTQSMLQYLVTVNTQPSTQYTFSSMLIGATSGTLYNSYSTTVTTPAPPPPFFPPYFPPYFPPFFPPYFPPYFPPFFPPYFPPNPSWITRILANTDGNLIEGQPFSDGVSANYVNTYAIYSGSLPAGLSLNASTGVVSGTPAQGSAGSYSFVISASGDGGTIYTNTLYLTVLDDGGKLRVYNTATSQWEESTVYVYNSNTSQWEEGKVYVYNSATATWDKSQ
jgi:hypothetical protein